jgi:hypothetical protein
MHPSYQKIQKYLQLICRICLGQKLQKIRLLTQKKGGDNFSPFFRELEFPSGKFLFVWDLSKWKPWFYIQLGYLYHANLILFLTCDLLLQKCGTCLQQLGILSSYKLVKFVPVLQLLF